jgi:RHS repeat-associated protein
MRATARRLSIFLAVFVVMVFAWSAAAFGAVSGRADALGGPSPLESALVTPGSPVEVEQLQAVARVRWSSPEAVSVRRDSATLYQRRDRQQAVRLVGEVFPGLVAQTAGGVPVLARGERITGLPTIDSAAVDLGGGKHGVIDSTVPLAVEASAGRRVPVDLGLEDAGSAFVPRRPAAAVRIPRRAGSGVVLSRSGLSVTPVDAHGRPLAGSEGVVDDGTSVVYANTATDADTVAKPTATGFELSTVLRSINSPRRLFYRVTLPAGGRLVPSGGSSGPVEVVTHGKVIATVAAPVAVDAAGRAVPVSMTVSRDILDLDVNLAPEEDQYPIYVDPTVTDNEILFNPGTWLFYTDDAGVFEGEGGTGQLVDHYPGPTEKLAYGPGDYGFFSYTTQGASRIYAFVASVREVQASRSQVADQFELRTGGGTIESGNGEGGKAEKTEPVETGERERTGVTVCRETSCGPVAVSGGGQNAAYFEQKAQGESPREGYFDLALTAASVEINQEQAPTASFDTSDATVEGLPNALLSGKWYKSTSSVMFGLAAQDPGIGVAKEGLSSSSKSGWGYSLKNEARNECRGVQCNQCYEPACLGKASGTGKLLTYSLAGAAGGELPEGEDTVEGKVEDDAGLNATATAKIKVDNVPPHNLSLTGLPSTHEIVDGQHVALRASASDGTSPTVSSGIASIMLQLDGQPISGPQGGCTPGPCTGSAEWTLSGENYAAGQHTLTLVATDNAGNVAQEEFHVTFHHPENVAVAPGSVNPVTGELSLSATDVAVGVPGGGLTVSRGYRSRHLAQGTEGPLGPQWSMSLAAQQSLSRVPGGMMLTAGSGGQVVFASKGKGEFTSPTGDAGMVLTEKLVEGKTVFTLAENGSVTTFELPVGSSGGVWTPSSSEGPNGTSLTLYKFKLAGGVIEPTEELAPVPAGVSCGREVSELKAGCRALKFEYDEGETKAKGEKASEWGEVAGHLSRVRYIAWNASKAKVEPVVAEYAYDVKGRLRAEWNPQITPSLLKTTYGYDAEGHVTAVNAPGHEPWLLENGTIPGDASSGRLLAVNVPAAGTALGTGEAPANTEAPTLSSTKPAVGTKISVNLTSEKTPGKWSASPLAFIYQWEDCNSSGKECTPIQGAVNQAYYPVAGDEGHTLVAQAVALNATGAVAASSATTSAVASGTPNTPLPEPPYVGSSAVSTLEYQVPVSGSGAPHELSGTETAKWGQADDPDEAMAIFPPDKVMGWPAAKWERETVYYLDGKDRAVNTASPTGGISVAEYNLYNDVKRTLTPDNRLRAVTEGCKAGEECKSATENSYEEGGSEPGTELLSSLGPQHTVKLAVGKEGKAYEEVQARTHTSYAYNQGAPSEGGPYHLVTETIEDAQTASKEEFDKRTTKMSYSGESNLGWKLHKPTSVITDPGSGKLNLVHTTTYNATTGAILETTTPTGNAEYPPPALALQFGKEGSENGQFNAPKGLALDSKGNVWIANDGNSKVEEYGPEGKFIKSIGSYGTGTGQFKNPKGVAIDSKNDVWVADTGNSRLEEYNEKYELVRTVGKLGTEEGAFNEPKGIAVDSHNNVWVVDTNNNRVQEFNEKGELIKGAFGEKGTGKGQFTEAHDIFVDSKGNIWVSDTGNNRVEEFNSEKKWVATIGEKGSGNGQLNGPQGVALDAKGHLWVADTLNARYEEFSEKGEYLTQFGTKGKGSGQFEEPRGLAIDTTGALWTADTNNNRIQKWVSNIGGAHTTKTIYYSSAANAEYKECGERPEFANLPCETTPAAQPGTIGLPELAITKYTYNIWSEPETTTETVATTTRTKTNTYDEAGRLKTTAISSSIGEPLPTVSDEYNKETGALEKQSTTTSGKTKTIASIYNKLGQLESYTDATENTSTYEYDLDGRIKTVNNGKGTETVTYSTTTGLPTELVNEYLTTKLAFTATYDAEGNMLTESYPNGMTATYTYNSVGKPTTLEYKKTTHCTEKCVWLTDSITPSIHGQWLEQTSTLSHQTYTYDNAGRLTQVQNTPAGQGCTTRIYSYDEDSNRTGLTTREPGAEGKCATTGGKLETHVYDTADRLVDNGTAYNTFGDITTLPGQNTEDPELTSTYYVDNQAASQKQKKQTVGYTLDPTGRTIETISTGEPFNATVDSHYAGPNNTPAWSVNPVTSETSRNIAGINGSLIAIQNDGETPELQLADLHGDIIAKAYLSETATELAAKADTSEFGVPTVTAPAKYSWLGSIELPTELPSGVTTMGVRSYVPELGRFLQPDSIPGGSANAYSYTFGDPVNTTDPTGAYTATASKAAELAMALYGQGIAAQRNAERRQREAAEKVAAELAAEAAAQAAAAAAAAGPQNASEEGPSEEWEEWWEEEGGWEYVSDHQHGEAGAHEPHPEAAVLYQPLGEAAGGELAERGQPEHGGNAHDVSGDGCGDGGYCHGHWVKRSEKGHRHGEPIGGSPLEPLDGFCLTAGAFNPFTGYYCAAYDLGRAASH